MTAFQHLDSYTNGPSNAKPTFDDEQDFSSDISNDDMLDIIKQVIPCSNEALFILLAGWWRVAIGCGIRQRNFDPEINGKCIGVLVAS